MVLGNERCERGMKRDVYCCEERLFRIQMLVRRKGRLICRDLREISKSIRGWQEDREGFIHLEGDVPLC